MAVNDIKTGGCSGAPGGGVATGATPAHDAPPCPLASKEGGPERVPAAGNGNGTSLNNSGSNGNYWSSVPNSDSNNARNLNFNSGNHNTNDNNRYNGFSVRPVPGFASGGIGGVGHRRVLDNPGRLLADLITAYHDARRCKRACPCQTRFEMNQEAELVKLRDELLGRRYKARPSKCFIIHDPKMREVFAAEFRDRIVHHLFYNYTHELFERTFIADSYSCIEGRGTHYGIERLKHHILSCSESWSRPCYVLKLDVKGYFMSINRAMLLARCREILAKERRRRPALDMEFADYLLESICMLDPVENCRVVGDRNEWKRLPREKTLFCSKPGCGLPIGNLSSQLFSNVYLGVFDEFMKRQVKCRHYGRYVDDAFVAGSDKAELYGIVPKAREFLRDELGLELNEDKVLVVDAYKGVEFLGAYVKPCRTYISRRSLKRIRAHLKEIDWKEPPERVQARVNSMLGTLSHCDSYLLRKVLAHEARLYERGRVSGDCLRFEPDALRSYGWKRKECC